MKKIFRVFEIGNFEKDLKKLLTKNEILEYEKFKENLKVGIISGKPLSYDFFREQKICGKRIYFLIYEDKKIILFVDSSKKKYQQQTIKEIKKLIPEFKKFAYEIYNSL